MLKLFKLAPNNPKISNVYFVVGCLSVHFPPSLAYRSREITIKIWSKGPIFILLTVFD